MKRKWGGGLIRLHVLLGQQHSSSVLKFFKALVSIDYLSFGGAVAILVGEVCGPIFWPCLAGEVMHFLHLLLETTKFTADSDQDYGNDDSGRNVNDYEATLSVFILNRNSLWTFSNHFSLKLTKPNYQKNMNEQDLQTYRLKYERSLHVHRS